MAATRVYDPREFNIALEQCFSDIANKYIGDKATAHISKRIAQFIDNYLYSVAGQIPADGLNRATALKILIRTIIKDQLADFAMVFHKEIGGPHPSFWFSSETRSIDALFTWLSDHQPHWNAHLANLSKERQDMVATWRNGDHLPSAQSLHLLSQPDILNEKVKNSINWDMIKPLLFFARSIDFTKGEELGCLLICEARLALWGVGHKVDVREEIRSIQADLLKSLGSAQSLINKLELGLKRTVAKSEPDQYKNIIHQVRELINTSEKLQHTDYWIDLYDARWHVFSGDLKVANDLYKNAFEKAAFVAGENQKYIVEEAIVVAASQPNPDKVFLKQLKWMQINFGYDIPSITESTPSQKVSDNIENWELDLWKASFDRIFPKAGYFPKTEFKPASIAQGPLILPDISKIKPDYRYPNRIMKIGETRQRAMPQLVWFALNENVEICRKLIDLGADVNVQSEVGDTPILIAIQVLNITEMPFMSLKDDLFKLISNQVHSKEIINTRTQKKRLLPIISAVETGRVDVVGRVLEMGADPNGRGKTDEQTALNVCLKIIGKLKDPRKYWESQDSMPTTPELLDSIRRYCPGMSGFSLDHQLQFMKDMKSPPLNVENVEMMNIVKDTYTKRMLENMSIDDMRKIARLLIQSGADVNAEHSSPIKGYTPLMLAAELDERDIFKLMLDHGGDIKKCYEKYDKGIIRAISILDIAINFRSEGIMQVLKDISPQ